MPTTIELVTERPGPVDVEFMQLTDAPVSSRSTWNQDDWFLDSGVAGAVPARISFSQVPQVFKLVARTAIWSALTDPRTERHPKPATVEAKSRELFRVLTWVAGSGLTLAEIDESEFEAFLDELQEEIEDGGFRKRATADRKASYSGVSRLLSSWALLRDQAPSMRASGLDALAIDPFHNRTPHSLAEDFTGDEKGRTRPLPDEVAHALFRAAEAIVGTPADELMKAHESFLAEQAAWRRARSSTLGSRLSPLEFSPLIPGGKPWLEAPDDERGTAHAATLKRGLIRVMGGASLLVFATTGIRTSELLSFGAGTDAVAGLPACMTRERSDSGQFDLYRLHGRVFKHMAEGTPVSWVCACTVADDSEEPLMLRAVRVLQGGLEPLRAIASPGNANRLMVCHGQGVLGGSGANVTPMSSSVLRLWLRAFMSEAIDWEALPDVTRDGTDIRQLKSGRGAGIRPTHWRKTLVHFMLRLDGRMALPLARHLKHFCSESVRSGYFISDPKLLEEAADAMARELARTLVGMATGERTATGWLADLMLVHIEDIRQVMGGLSGEQAVAVVQEWARERGLGLFNASPGRCGLRLMPQNALCHQVAGTAAWWQKAPSPTRCDEHCAHCKCCLVDAEHLNFWTSRYCATRRQVLISRRLGREQEAWVHAGQAAVAAATLKRIGGRIPPDEEIL